MADYVNSIATSRQQLHSILTNYFNMEELNELAFLMGLDFDNVSGATKSAKATSLISYCERTLLVSHLISKAKEKRPVLQDTEWPTPWHLEPKHTVKLVKDRAPRKDETSPLGWWTTTLIGVFVPTLLLIYSHQVSDGLPALLLLSGGLIGGAMASWVAKEMRLGVFFTISASIILGSVVAISLAQLVGGQ